MSNYDQDANQDANQDLQNRNDDDVGEKTSVDGHALFKRAIMEAMELKFKKWQEAEEAVELPPPSKRYRRCMNRIFREHVGASIPFPEVDNLYERIRSRLVIKLKINEFLDRREARRREK